MNAYAWTGIPRATGVATVSYIYVTNLFLKKEVKSQPKTPWL